MSTSWTVTLIAGALTLTLALGTLVVGGAIWVGYATQRDVGGFVVSDTIVVTSEHSAIVLDDVIRSTVDISPVDGLPTGAVELRVDATSLTGRSLFVGVAATEDVQTHLASITHDRVVAVGANGSGVRSEQVDGSDRPVSERDTVTWIASANGSRAESISWDASGGDWSVVIANDDGSSGVSAEVNGAVRSAIAWRLGIGLVLAGLILAAIGIALLARCRRNGTQVGPFEDEPASDDPLILVEGRLDPDVSRWTWLVKWVLAIPHLLVLAVLWPTFVVLTVVAFVAILVTGRYPRSVFDLNVGILRWSWRVGFYALTAMGTDRYPPFTLADTDYPARLDVAYPTRLSRGLVLVKSWLLALPHLIVVGVLTTGVIWWVYEPFAGGAAVRIGGGVIGILVVVAGVALLVTGRYPAPLFDLVVGLNRWVYRVIAYVALMRDEYPPFRLDIGEEEPNPPSDGPVADIRERATSAGTK